MDNKKKCIALIALLIALMALSGGGTSTINNFFNSTNITNGSNFTFNGTLTYGLSEINMTNGFTYFYNGTTIIEQIPLGSFSVATDLDMEGNNITNCQNCAVNSTIQITETQVTNLTTDLNKKVNKTGDTMTGDLNINNAFLNLTTNQTFNFDFNTVPKLMRNSTSTTLRTAPLATLNMFLQVDGGIGNGGGPAIIFMNKDNVSQGSTEYNIGRMAVAWDNKSINTSRLDFFIRSGIADTTGLTPGFSVYSNSFSTPLTNKNSTLETGNLKLTNLSGSGNAILCVNASGNIYRGNPGC